jgi:hypothetical protein
MSGCTFGVDRRRFAGLMAYGERSDSAVGAAGSAPHRPRPLTTPFAISQLGQLKPRLIGAVSQVFDPSAQQHREPGARVRAALPDRVRRLKDERHPPALVGARRRATDDGAHRARQCAGAGAVGRIHRRRPAVGELDRRRRRSEYSQSSATQTEPAAARCSSSSQPGSGAPRPARRSRPATRWRSSPTGSLRRAARPPCGPPPSTPPSG